ncbi:hypothetical protein ABCW43_00255 [Neorhizobium sp. IRAMC:178]|uniref:hypothetical protein n=1 Tax=Neorhizobium tunisiense TaxID=3144793 RepID=UPI0031F65780
MSEISEYEAFNGPVHPVVYGNWDFDISRAPKGKTVSHQRLVPGKEAGDECSARTFEVFEADDVILASKCGKVIKSYWLPKENRWAGFKAGEEIRAWQAWPSHPDAPPAQAKKDEQAK